MQTEPGTDDAPPADPAGQAMHILTSDGKPIRGALEAIPACSEIDNLHLEPDGSIGFDFGNWIEQWFEDARPVEQPHPETGRRGFIFVDFASNGHHEDDLVRCRPATRYAACPLCRAVGPAESLK